MEVLARERLRCLKNLVICSVANLYTDAIEANFRKRDKSIENVVNILLFFLIIIN